MNDAEASWDYLLTTVNALTGGGWDVQLQVKSAKDDPLYTEPFRVAVIATKPTGEERVWVSGAKYGDVVPTIMRCMHNVLTKMEPISQAKPSTFGELS